MVKIDEKDNPVKINSHNVDANTDNEKDQINTIGRKNCDTKVLLEKDSMDVTTSLMGTQCQLRANQVKQSNYLYQM